LSLRQHACLNGNLNTFCFLPASILALHASFVSFDPAAER